MKSAKELIYHRRSANSHPLGHWLISPLQRRIGRKEQHNVKASHAVAMAFSFAATRSQMGHVSRAKSQNVVSSRQTAVSSLRLHFSTQCQHRHARTSAPRRIQREEILLGCLGSRFRLG